MEKRMFQILDEMNINDENLKTQTCGVCPDFVRGQKTKKGGEVTMGVPENVLMDLLNDEKKIHPILLIIDMPAYSRQKVATKPVRTAAEILEQMERLKSAKNLTHGYREDVHAVLEWVLGADNISEDGRFDPFK